MSALEELLRQLADPDEVLGDTDRYELPLVEQLTPGERAVFVEKLTAAAVKEDRRAILTLGLMKATQARRELLVLGARTDRLGRLARRALVMLGDGLSVVNEICADVLNAQADFYRGDAVEDLGRLQSPIARQALLQALADPTERVRVGAFKALVESYGLAQRLKGPQGWPELTTELELLGVFLDRDLPAFVEMGVAELRQVFGRLDSGVSPEALGIAWEAKPHEELLSRVRAVLFEPAQPLPLEELAALKGKWRRWAEAMIAFRLAAHDPRVPEAMVKLGAAWTVPVLMSVARDEKAPAELREALKGAARELAEAQPRGGAWKGLGTGCF